MPDATQSIRDPHLMTGGGEVDATNQGILNREDFLGDSRSKRETANRAVIRARIDLEPPRSAQFIARWTLARCEHLLGQA
jgi:hypothetical protein